jgi:hypothetical protein
MSRRILLLVALLMTGILITASTAGFILGRDVGNNELLEAFANESRQVRENDTRFQECVSALLFLDLEQRRRLTDDRLAEVCRLDATHIRDLRQRLGEP